ncbi:MAG: hydrogenase [Chloroflexi bacterium]|nr:hydrogenase [Chloroflexota bacterium]
MNAFADLFLVFVVLTNLILLGSSRLRATIWVLASQGVAVGFLSLVVAEDGLTLLLILIAAVNVSLKGFVIPKLLLRSLRSANVRHEVEPFVGFSASVILGVLALIGSMWLTSGLSFHKGPSTSLGLPVCLSTILIGLLLIVSRRQALMQVVGYLTMENGIYGLGLMVVGEQPLVVELGVLLDVFVAVFVMGIAMFHISQEFDHIDVHKMNELKG